MLYISLIITTYNWPEALQKVLSSVLIQTYAHFEVIVADDGSQKETTKVIQSFMPFFHGRLKHCWQKDQGVWLSLSNHALQHAKVSTLSSLMGI